MSNYIVATLKTRIQAETAYTRLEQAGVPLAQVSIYGQGFNTTDSKPLLDPTLQQWLRIRLMLMWLLPFGFFAGFTFNQITQLTIIPGFGHIGDAIIGGLLGLGAGALGAFTYGGGSELYLNRDLVPYAQRLQKGKYLVVVSGSERLIQEANRVLRILEFDNLQMYEILGPEMSPS